MKNTNNIDYTKEKVERGIIMDYKKLSPKELADAYRKASDFTKRRILRSGIDLKSLIEQLSGNEVVKLAQVHPYKELLCDTLLENIKSYKNPIKADKGSLEPNSDYEHLGLIISGIETTKRTTFFSRIMDSIRGRDTKLIEGTIDKKIEELKKANQLVSASQVMATDYWKRDMVDSRGNARDNIVEETPFKAIIDRKINSLFWERAVEKYGYPSAEQSQEFFKEAYSDLVEPDKKDVAEVFGIVEMTTHCSKTHDYIYDDGVQINSVQKVDNFEINGENLGEVFLVKRSHTDDQNQEQETLVYRKNAETGILEKIGNTHMAYKTLYFYIDLPGGKRLTAQPEEVTYDEKENITANELHTKALMEEIKNNLGQDVDIAELTEVQIPAKTRVGYMTGADRTGFLAKTIDANGSVSYQMLTFGDDYSKTGVMTVSKAKEEMFRSIELPTIHSDGEQVRRDTAKVAATLNMDGEELQIFTDNHGNTRVAEIFDGKNKAYSIMTRTVFKDTRQREIARPDKDDARQRSLQLMPEKKNSQNIAQVVPKDMDDDREM
ncbi:MAG: hypothetical protein K6B70_05415 [Clostridia bacterium]|nr:hypothetical protein [Clostridia bacterium]